MSDLDYDELQRAAARTATDRFIVPMLQREFPEILERVSVALTGSASFGAAVKWSDFDGTVFLLHESTCTLDHLDELGHPLRALGRNLKYLPEMPDVSNWRHQIGYAVECLRNALIDANGISVELALRPFG